MTSLLPEQGMKCAEPLDAPNNSTRDASVASLNTLPQYHVSMVHVDFNSTEDCCRISCRTEPSGNDNRYFDKVV